jgi:hypothetical protein
MAATEFAMIVPMMLVMLFGTIEVSSGVAVIARSRWSRGLCPISPRSPGG